MAISWLLAIVLCIYTPCLNHSSLLTNLFIPTEILAARKGMWTNVAKRLHKPVKIFPFGPIVEELMLYGTVAYELHDGRKTEVDWAARAQLVKEEERWKFGLYQVYLVSYL
jgi:hypothetical protein